MKWIWMSSLLSLTALMGCGGARLESDWRQQKITVDGRDREWLENKYFFEKEGVAIGLINDAEHLYIYLSSTDRALQMQVIRQGFIVSFDPKGGKKGKFAVRYPLGMKPRDLWALMESMDGRWGGGPDFGAVMKPEMLQAVYDAVMADGRMEIIGSSVYDRRFLPVASVPEIEVALGYGEGRLIYELKVPLKVVEGGGYRVGIGAQGLGAVGVGFETPELDLRELRQSRGTGAGGFGGRGMGGGMGVDGSGRRRRNSAFRDMMQPLRLWTKVQLAAH